MKKKNPMEDYRLELDEIDCEIVALLEKRMTVSEKVGQYKKEQGLPVLDEERERKILQSRGEMLMKKQYKNHITRIFDKILAESRKIQEDFLFGKRSSI